MNSISYTLYKLVLSLLSFHLLTISACKAPVKEADLKEQASISAEKGQWLQAAQQYEQLCQLDPTDEGANYNAGTNYLKANQPQKALDIFNSLVGPNKSDGDISKREARIAKAFYMLGDYQKVVNIAKQYAYPKMYRGLAREQLKALIQMDSMELLARQFEIHQQIGIFDDKGKQTGMDFLYRAICNELFLTANAIQLELYAQQFSLWLPEDKQDAGTMRNRAYAEYYMQNYDQAIESLEQAITLENSPRHLLELHMLLGICQAKKQNFEKALEQIEKLSILGDPPPRHDAFGAKAYNQARIQVAMVQPEAALKSLEKALEQKAEFWSNKFKEDGFLKALLVYPSFEKLIKAQ